MGEPVSNYNSRRHPPPIPQKNMKPSEKEQKTRVAASESFDNLADLESRVHEEIKELDKNKIFTEETYEINGLDTLKLVEDYEKAKNDGNEQKLDEIISKLDFITRDSPNTDKEKELDSPILYKDKEEPSFKQPFSEDSIDEAINISPEQEKELDADLNELRTYQIQDEIEQLKKKIVLLSENKSAIREEIKDLKENNELQFLEIRGLTNKLKELKKIHNKTNNSDIKNSSKDFFEEGFIENSLEKDEEKPIQENKFAQQKLKDIELSDSLRSQELRNEDQAYVEALSEKILRNGINGKDPVEELINDLEEPEQKYDGVGYIEPSKEFEEKPSDWNILINEQRNLRKQHLENKQFLLEKQKLSDQLNTLQNEFLSLVHEKDELLHEKAINTKFENAVHKVALKKLHTIELEASPKKGFFARTGAKLRQIGKRLFGTKTSPEPTSAAPTKDQAIDALYKEQIAPKPLPKPMSRMDAIIKKGLPDLPDLPPEAKK